MSGRIEREPLKCGAGCRGSARRTAAWEQGETLNCEVGWPVKRASVSGANVGAAALQDRDARRRDRHSGARAGIFRDRPGPPTGIGPAGGESGGLGLANASSYPRSRRHGLRVRKGPTGWHWAPGLELACVSHAEPSACERATDPGGTESGTVRGSDDHDLAFLVAVWSGLPEATKTELVRLAGDAVERGFVTHGVNKPL